MQGLKKQNRCLASRSKFFIPIFFSLFPIDTGRGSYKMQCLLNSQWTLRSYLNKYILQKKTKLTYLRFWVKVDLLRLLNCNMAIALSLSDLKNHIAVFHPHFLLTSLSVCVLLGSRGIIDTLISESKNVHMKIILSVL